MSDYRISQEINLFEIADKYAKRLQEQADEMTLNKAADTLAKFGYVKVVRCRDCKDYRASDATCHSWQWHNWDAAIEVEPDGFCAWAERKEGSDGLDAS